MGREYHNIRYSTEAAGGHDLRTVVSMLTPTTSSVSALPSRVSSPLIRRGAPLPPPTPTPSTRYWCLLSPVLFRICMYVCIVTWNNLRFVGIILAGFDCFLENHWDSGFNHLWIFFKGSGDQNPEFLSQQGIIPIGLPSPTTNRLLGRIVIGAAVLREMINVRSSVLSLQIIFGRWLKISELPEHRQYRSSVGIF